MPTRVYFEKALGDFGGVSFPIFETQTLCGPFISLSGPSLLRRFSGRSGYREWCYGHDDVPSVTVRGIDLVKLGLQVVEVGECHVVVVAPPLGGFLGDLVGHDVERLA